MPKIDLHTHSIASPDGSITMNQYKTALDSKKLDVIAITDHNRIDFAVKTQQELGSDRIIVGQEITTKQGDIVGLFLTEAIPADLDVEVAVSLIKKQRGLVYIPHPFETIRSGITMENLEKIKVHVAIIEAPNGRSLQPHNATATNWAANNNVAVVGSSDAHRAGALGKTYTETLIVPTKENLVQALKNANIRFRKPSISDLLAPKFNRLSGRKGKMS
jgi:predicted metal-dependent phosphoesterase TrpH